MRDPILMGLLGQSQQAIASQQRLCEQARQAALYGLGGIAATGQTFGYLDIVRDTEKPKKTKPSLRIELQRETDDWLKGVL